MDFRTPAQLIYTDSAQWSIAMAFITDKEKLKSGLIIFRRGDVTHRNFYCRINTKPLASILRAAQQAAMPPIPHPAWAFGGMRFVHAPLVHFSGRTAKRATDSGAPSLKHPLPDSSPRSLPLRRWRIESGRTAGPHKVSFRRSSASFRTSLLLCDMRRTGRNHHLIDHNHAEL